MPSTYRIKNWNVYNKALCSRGNVSLWIDEETQAQWRAQADSNKHGAQFTYSDIAIEAALTLRAVFRLPLRQTRGFLSSLFKLGSIKLPVPCYTTLCRRAKALTIGLDSKNNVKHLVVDSTGLKVFGEGEWKVRAHGFDKRRTWRKLHISVNPDTHEIISAAMTTNDVHDSQVFDDLIKDERGLKSVGADGAYDSQNCYDTLAKAGVVALIPPRKNAVIQQHGNSKRKPLARDENIREIRKVGRKKWKQESGYHRRSLAETAMFRLKTTFGGDLKSRSFDNQAVEGLLRCKIMNAMTDLGMPEAI